MLVKAERRRRFLGLILALLVLAMLCASTEAKPVTEVRVGITEYQKVEETYSKYYKLFKELSDASQDPITFKIAIGTYEEVNDWYNKGQIDVAILSAMPVAELLLSINFDKKLLEKIGESYIGTLTPTPNYQASPKKCGASQTPRNLLDDVYDGAEKEERSNSPSSYRTVCVVPKGSDITNFEQLAELQRQNKLRILFVRPFSVSGYLLPAYYMKEMKKLRLGADSYEFTYQHSNSLSRLMKANARGIDVDGKYLVAFVQDSTTYCGASADEKYFKRIETPELNAQEFRIPSEAVLINHRLAATDPAKYDSLKQKMFELFQGRQKVVEDKEKASPADRKYESPFKEFKAVGAEGNTPDDWSKSYAIVMRAIQSVDKPRTLPYRFTIDEIIKDLKIYKAKENSKDPDEEKVRPMRLALVLSGGGAKCAYQAGAIKQIETKLRASNSGDRNDVDIDLVVGTSGGAINALFVALGITSNETAQGCLETTWSQFQQRDFFEPSLLFTIVFGLSFGFVQAFLFTVGAVLFGRGTLNWNRLGKWIVGLVIIESLVAIYLDYFHMLSVSASFSILIQVVIILAVAAWFRLLSRRGVKDWWRQAGFTMLIASAIELFIKLAQVPLTNLLSGSKSHLYQHAWMVVTLFSSWSAPLPLLLGIMMLATGHKRVPDFKLSRRRHRVMLVRALAIGLAVMSAMFVLYFFLKMNSPSEQTAMESKFAEKVPELLQCLNLKYDAQPKKGETPLQALSGWIMQNNLLKRDLVITTSRLPMDERNETDPGKRTFADIQNLQTATQRPTGHSDEEMAKVTGSQLIPANQLPEDLYFYYAHKKEIAGDASDQKELYQVPLPPLGKQFVSFAEDINGSKLLDVVIGSGTIYPLFPYREVKGLKVDNQTVESVRIIDGGFIHNSPVDAAVKWGATHIILIEASPQPKPFPPHNFWENSLVAFNYLFAQAQSIDKQSMGSVEMFVLRPTTECDKLNRQINCEDTASPDMDTFDFCPAILKEAFKKGFDDAQDSRALFTRVLGSPLFREVSNEAGK